MPLQLVRVSWLSPGPEAMPFGWKSSDNRIERVPGITWRSSAPMKLTLRSAGFARSTEIAAMPVR